MSALRTFTDYVKNDLSKSGGAPGGNGTGAAGPQADDGPRTGPATPIRPNESAPKSPVSADYARSRGGSPYRVKNGDSWESVAAAFGVAVRDLIKFNFNTTVPEEINWYLRNYTGCNKPSPSGHNWMFSSSADPGIIYIPVKTTTAGPNAAPTANGKGDFSAVAKEVAMRLSALLPNYVRATSSGGPRAKILGDQMVTVKTAIVKKDYVAALSALAELEKLVALAIATQGQDSQAGGSGPSTPAKPPEAGPSTREKVETTVTTVGIVGSIISILEIGSGTAVGTTIGALLLPIGAFLLGTTIREQMDREEAAKKNFKMKMKSAAMVEAAHRAADQVKASGIPLRDLNQRGIAAVKANGERWREKMDDDVDTQLAKDFVTHSHPEAAWQAIYDGWVKGMAEDLADIYANPRMTQ